MTISYREGPFVADITGGLLCVRHDHQPLFTCRLRAQPWFVVHSDGLYAQNAHDALTPLYRGADAAQLLACLTTALQACETRRAVRRRLGAGMTAVALAATAWLALVPPVVLTPAGAGAPVSPREVNAPVSHPPVAGLRPPSVAAASPTAVPALSMTPSAAPAMMPTDGWSLPPAVRAELPEKLGKAAARGLFTVPLSSGHARTLYVFADPACPNCRRMEHHLETASGLVNVVIFPVTIEGREASLKALTPVMARPEAERAAAWKQLFAADAGIDVPGGAESASVVPNETQAETARGAIGVNEVAFRAYRLPGTPWTLSDDGRYVPQAVLSSPAALAAFLNGDQHDGQ